jgi:hypothetical protein
MGEMNSDQKSLEKQSNCHLCGKEADINNRLDGLKTCLNCTLKYYLELFQHKELNNVGFRAGDQIVAFYCPVAKDEVILYIKTLKVKYMPNRDPLFKFVVYFKQQNERSLKAFFVTAAAARHMIAKNGFKESTKDVWIPSEKVEEFKKALMEEIVKQKGKLLRMINKYKEWEYENNDIQG